MNLVCSKKSERQPANVTCKISLKATLMPGAVATKLHTPICTRPRMKPITAATRSLGRVRKFRAGSICLSGENFRRLSAISNFQPTLLNGYLHLCLNPEKLSCTSDPRHCHHCRSLHKVWNCMCLVPKHALLDFALNYGNLAG